MTKVKYIFQYIQKTGMPPVCGEMLEDEDQEIATINIIERLQIAGFELVSVPERTRE